MYNLR